MDIVYEPRDERKDVRVNSKQVKNLNKHRCMCYPCCWKIQPFIYVLLSFLRGLFCIQSGSTQKQEF